MMVDYELSELFKKDGVDKQLIIQTDDKKVTITNTELHQEKFELTESLCSESELAFGSCEASSIKFTMSNVFTSLKGKWITVTMSLHGNADKPFQFGRYKVYSDKPTADRTQRDVVAYDALYDIINTNVMGWYDSVLPNLDSTITLKNFRDSFFEYFGVAQKDITLPNDSMVIKRSLDKETGNVQTNVLSGSTVIKAICEINGCFGHINRQGQFEYIFLKQDIQGLYPANDLYPADNLYPKSPDSYRINKSDYITADYEDYIVESITKLQIRSSDSDVGTIIGNGNAYIIENNMLTYQKTADEMQKIAQNIYNKISKIRYRPFTADLRGNPCLEVGDAIRILTKNAIVESYVLERDLKGIQALRDSFSSVGEQYYSEKVNSVQTDIKQLENKSNVLFRNIEETRSTIKDVQDGLESQIKQTADSVTAEVKRASEAEGELKTSIKETADGITSEVSKKVGNDEIISKINQSAETVMIEADKINLKGTIVVGDLAENSGIAKSDDIPTDNNQLANGAGYQTSSDVTVITKNTVTTEYVNALNVKAGSVDAENITGTTISGKKITGAAGEFTQEFSVDNNLAKFEISDHKILLAPKTGGAYTEANSLRIELDYDSPTRAWMYTPPFLVGQTATFDNVAVAGQDIKQLFELRSQKRIDLSVAAGTDTYFTFTSLGKLSGYTRAMVNVSIAGTMSSFMNHYQTGYTDNDVTIRVKNLATKAFNGSIEVTCLYMKDGFFNLKRTGA